MSGRHVLLVSGYYRPENTGIGVYTGLWAEALRSAGATVSVLTTFPHYPSWRVHDSYRRYSAPMQEEIAGIAVHRIPALIPSKPGVAGRALFDASFFLQQPKVPAGVEAVVGVIPTVGVGWAAQKVARRLKVPLGLVVQDLSGPAAAQSGVPGGRLVSGGVQMLEQRLLRKAAAVAIVSPSFADYAYASGVGVSQLHEVRNWSHTAPARGGRAETRKLLAWPSSTAVALHTGNMGYKQGLDNIVAAAKLACGQDADVLFVLLGDGNQRLHIELLARGVRCIRIDGFVPDALYSDALAAADVLLVNERKSVVDMSLPSKLTSYFASGRPVIAAVPAEGATALEVRRAGAGVIVEPERPDLLLDAILNLTRDTATAEALGARGATYAQENLAPGPNQERVCEFVAELLAGPSR